MPALVHTTFRVSNAKQFKESFEEKSEHGVGGYIPDAMMSTDPITGFKTLPSSGITVGQVNDVNDIPFYALDDQMYLFIGRVSAWNAYDTSDGIPDPNINENAPPYPKDSMKDSHFNHWDDMIAAKKVSAGEVSHVIKRERADEIKDGVRNWQRGKRYDTFDDRADNLFDDDVLIHTVNARFRVYKCIKQGIGEFKMFDDAALIGSQGSETMYKSGAQKIWCWTHQSRREPQRTDPDVPGITEDFMTVGDQFNDGYQWKYYYTIDAGEALKFVTTSYIPVRTIRKENGVRTNDYSHQYKVEENAIPGGILNVLVGKIPVEGSDGTVYGYELSGGGAGYMQCAANSAAVIMNYDGPNGTMSFEVPDFDNEVEQARVSWPDPIQAASSSTNENRFSFSNPSTYLGDMNLGGTADYNALFRGAYGVVVTAIDPTFATIGQEVVKRYVYPIDNVQENGGKLTFHIDSAWISERQANSTFDTNIKGLTTTAIWNNLDVEIAIHPKVHIEANHQSSTECDKTNSFEAYAICEPFWDNTTPAYYQGELGRVIDVRVTNPGMYHYRIDSAYVKNRGSLVTAAGTKAALPPGIADREASVFACIPPVGGHGADPTGEFGGFNVMINARFEGTEADEFTVGNEFRKIGILKNPLAYANTADGYLDTAVRTDLNSLSIGPQEYTKLFREYKTDQCYRINLAGDSYLVSDPAGNTIFFEPDMDIAFYANCVGAATWTSSTQMQGGSSKEYVHGDLIATAKLVDHDTINKRIRVIKPRGDFYTILEGAPGPNVTANVVSITPHSVEKDNWPDANVFVQSLQDANTAEEPGMLPGSGKVLYVENRSMVSRSSNQTEDLKISIQF